MCIQVLIIVDGHSVSDGTLTCSGQHTNMDVLIVPLDRGCGVFLWHSAWWFLVSKSSWGPEEVDEGARPAGSSSCVADGGASIPSGSMSCGSPSSSISCGSPSSPMSRGSPSSSAFPGCSSSWTSSSSSFPMSRGSSPSSLSSTQAREEDRNIEVEHKQPQKRRQGQFYLSSILSHFLGLSSPPHLVSLMLYSSRSGRIATIPFLCVTLTSLSAFSLFLRAT